MIYGGKKSNSNPMEACQGFVNRGEVLEVHPPGC